MTSSDKFASFWRIMGTHGIAVFSTGADNIISSRPVSTVIFGEGFYFQTDESYLKYRQIMKNPNAAVCCKNISVTGICTALGKPSENPDFMRALTRYYPLAAARYSGLPSERVIKFLPAAAYRWIYEKGQPFKECWDFRTEKYKKEKM